MIGSKDTLPNMTKLLKLLTNKKMATFSVSDPQLNDARRLPLVPSLLLLTMTPVAPTNGQLCDFATYSGVHTNASEPVVSQAGLLLYLQQQKKDYIKKNEKKSDLAPSKGVTLPSGIAHFPDQTISFLKEHNITPEFINKSQEGSLIIEFEAGGIYHMAEFYPDGDIVLLKRNPTSTDAWDLREDNYFQKFESEVLQELKCEPA